MTARFQQPGQDGQVRERGGVKTGLVLEGGALRTIYSSGVTDGFLEGGLDFDYVVGASAGIAYGVSFISRQYRRNLEILMRFANDRRYMGARNLLRPGNRSYFGLEFSFATIPNELVLYDYAACEAWPGEAEAVVTDVAEGEAAYFPVDGRDPSFLLLQATCAMPVLFPIIEYQGVKCLDGGASDGIPWKRALEKGCERVVVVLTRERGYRRSPDKLMPAIRRIYRKYPRFVDVMERRAESYNRCREELFQAERRGDVLLFSPDSTQGFSRVERDVVKIHALWQQGLDHARSRMDEVRDYLRRD